MTPSMGCKQQLRSNRIFKVIRDFETMFYDEFQKCGIKKCGHCNGKGFDKHLTNMCLNCGGMGYTGFKRINGEFVCRSCNGYGCSMCNSRGIVDWVTHARGSDIMEEKYF